MTVVSATSPLAVAQQRAGSLRDSGDLSGARMTLEYALEAARPVFGEDDTEVLATAHQLAVLHREAGEPTAARRVLEEAIAAGLRRLGEAEPLILAISFDLGEVAEELGNRHEARRNFGRVAAGAAILGADDWRVRAARAYLGDDAPAPVETSAPTVPQPLSTGPKHRSPLTEATMSLPTLDRRGTEAAPAAAASPDQAPAAPPAAAAAFEPPTSQPDQPPSPPQPLPGPHDRPGPRDLPGPHDVPARPDVGGPHWPAHHDVSGSRQHPPTDRRLQEPWQTQSAHMPQQRHGTSTPSPDPGSGLSPQAMATSTTQHPAMPAPTMPATTDTSTVRSPHPATAPVTTPPPAVPTAPTRPAPAPMSAGTAAGMPTPMSAGTAAGMPTPTPPAAAAAAGAMAAGAMPVFATPSPSAQARVYPEADPPPRGRGIMVFAAVAASIAAVVAVIALVVVLTATRPWSDDVPGGSTTVAGDPPGDVRLRDAGEAITVTWSDPSTGRVSFIVAGGRSGEQLRAMGQVGPGKTSHQLSGLNPALNYCFTVVAVYGPNQLATAQPACTTRASAGPTRSPG